MTKYLLALVLLTNAFITNAQFKQASHASISLSCEGEISDRDYENAILNFNTASQDFAASINLSDLLSEYIDKSTLAPDMLPVNFSAKINIPGLDFKSAANNGESYTFDTKVELNGITKTVSVRYIFLFAPKVSETINGAPLCSFRMDFAFIIHPSDFGLQGVLPEICDEITINVHDGLLNKLNQ